MKNLGLPPVPPGLSEEAGAFWQKITRTWSLEDSSLLILRTACEALDEMRGAQKLIAAEGMVVTDRWHQKKPHPAVAIARDARIALLRLIKQLGLDLEPLNDGPGRPKS